MPFSTLDKTIPRLPNNYPSKPKTIGEYLLKVRIDSNLSKKALVKQIGVSSASVVWWEQEKGKPEVRQMKGIIAFLGFYPLPEPTNLTEHIRKYRYVNGLTLEEFGKLLAVDGVTVWTWENRKHVQAEDMVPKIQMIINRKEFSH